MTAVETKPDEPVTPAMLVSEINQKFPQCRPVFGKYGIAGCGGQLEPPEPLFLFAAAHHVALRELVNELNAAVRGEWKEEDRRPKTDDGLESETLYKRFVFVALVIALTAGFALGAVNLTRIALAQSYYTIDGALKQAHGHAQIFGWVGLFVMGVAFHAVPRFKMVTLRPVRAVKACFALMVASVGLRVVAQSFAVTVWGGVAVLCSGLLELAAIGLFVWLIGRVVVSSTQPREFYEKFIWASVGWLAVLGAWNFALTVQMVAHQYTVVPALADTLFVHAALFGFVANMIFGFSLRVLPHFLGLREAKVWAANAAFALWNAAIFLRYPLEQLAGIASSLELVAAMLFVWALGIFAKRRTRIEIKGVDNTFAWFIYLGYVWLLLAAAQPFHADIFRLTASARHAMAVGFITSVMFGVGSRVLPIFNGTNLYSRRALRASFWLQAVGSTIALAMAYSARRGAPWNYLWSALAGYCVLAAVALFAWNMMMTLRVKAEKFTRESLVALNTRIAELLEVWPELRPVLIHGGLAGLAAMRHSPPRFVTIEFAARRHDIDPQPLIATLNAEIQRRTSI